MKALQFRNEVRATMWDTKESYAHKYHQKSKERQENGGGSSQSKGSKPRKSTTCRLGRCWKGEDESGEKKPKQGTSGLWSMRATNCT